MMLAVTGTPGTGKTSSTKLLEDEIEVLHLNEMAKRLELFEGYDEDRNSWIVDIDKIRDKLPNKGIIESHFSHLLPVDEVIVLRCHPNELKKRLNSSKTEIKENIESEALDYILMEAIAKNNKVHEIDTTDKDLNEVSDLIKQIYEGKIEEEPGKVDWSEWLMENG
ncbi:MAG: Broad-specificity NMP kinase Fap7 [Candidatus Methanohalarchaeum thermophilum]|uniref:Putative adenylate kinase n=1 Tax=Methanohalarchaeum thermophilum TaxID=1903181 RepID=A0A1Q6DTK9_METT1|nr:MAG: Broad-specificity NMP kinase Fap7 [Candidatus Methanohalarchaeum thermophilum]